MALISKLNAIGDAIRGKTGKTDKLTLDQMPTEIASIETGGGGSVENLDTVLAEQDTLIEELKAVLNGKASGNGETDEIARPFLEGTITDLSNNVARSVKPHAFYNDPHLKSVDLPNAQTVGRYAFYECEQLENVNIPNAITIEESAFSCDYNLKHINMPNVKFLYIGAFEECYELELTELPSELTEISSYAFYKCYKLVNLRIPSKVTGIFNVAFMYCTGLTTVTFEGTPEEISNSAFSSCANLLTINVPWEEGAVANAPWGATNATINYNYVEEASNE